MDSHFIFLLIAAFLFLFPCSSQSRSAPFAMRISCGAREDVRTPPTNALWSRDFGYTGGIPTNGSHTSFIAPPLKTVRYFPLYAGPENCYNFDRLANGHYSMRIFFGSVEHASIDNEPLFDVSIEGTLIYSLKSGWSSRDSEAFVEALVFVVDGTASLCFISTGHGEPAILSIEILQMDDRAYYYGPQFSQGTIFRTIERLSCGEHRAKFGEDYGGNQWGGDRFWDRILHSDSGSDNRKSTTKAIKHSSVAPNFYPQGLYQIALLSTDAQPVLAFTLDVDPNRNYSIWLHFSEIDPTVTGSGQRVFDIFINGAIEFEDVDIVKLSGDVFSALVLNKTVAVNGRSLTIMIKPKKGSHAIISAIEVFEIIDAEANTLPSEVTALQHLKSTLGLPLHFAWNGDPCAPQQHPWKGVDCQLDRSSGKWVIDGLSLDNQGLGGILPKEISQLGHLLSINMSGNSIHGSLPSSIGNITTLEILDLSYNSFNGSIPENFGQLTSLRRLNLNSNSLSGRVPAALGGRLLHRASYNFTDNAGLCGIPGLQSCEAHLSVGAIIGILIGACVGLLVTVTCLVCWWKRRQNILRAQRIAARDAPYAKARTHFSRDVQMARHHHVHDNTRTAAENGPSLIS